MLAARKVLQFLSMLTDRIYNSRPMKDGKAAIDECQRRLVLSLETCILGQAFRSRAMGLRAIAFPSAFC